MKRHIGTATIFVWIGFVLAISFMEAWLKFRAPGVTLPIGLGIGRLVFGALNKMEWLFSLVCLVTLLFEKNTQTNTKLSLSIPIMIVLMQTFWMLPLLDMRAELHISGNSVPPSNIHFYYVMVESIKVVALILSGALLFKPLSMNNNPK